jgi:hypothetical protein
MFIIKFTIKLNLPFFFEFLTLVVLDTCEVSSVLVSELEVNDSVVSSLEVVCCSCSESLLEPKSFNN